ncbi:uncharacterized protein EV420DRAFT_446567 [Desarmillaria tabescens]|uniref:IMD domain-containing protein n=1 Tax=Armillaria tabescens TaxID=1929756 RepID=A0AA39NLY7_ARMTA|nr:uncharacterized protein EV420DRAFT_446567 [Desarmillaria tabescens]KAK0468093.1 hypothetical protein EV420DRAFT_446567 [Desarmillaria tabescens]
MAPHRPRSLRGLAFGSRRNSSAGPPSPTFSDTTNVSQMNFGANGPEKIITRSNLKASLQAYEELMNTSANYRLALVAMSKATAAFADAMEACSGLKGPSYESGTRLQAASGLHHLIGNHWHVLAEAIDKKFEKPLRQHLETYRTIVIERSASYERALREKSRVIRDTEMRNMNRKERNLQSFREALSVLQQQVDDLDDLKAAHYREIIEHEEEVWDVVQGKVCLVVRSTMDLFDRFTAKASDPVIEPMLQTVPDPFDSYGPPQAEDQIFSILPPLSILTNPTSSTSATPIMTTPELNSMDGLPSSSSSRNSSMTWTPNTSNGLYTSESTEWADVSPTSTSPTPPRSVSPPVSRRHSAPPISQPGHHSRRSESSKLRSVLSAIDEGHSRQGSHEASQTEPAPYTSVLNGASPAQPQPEKESSFNWTSPFTYGRSPYEDIDDGATPRGSAYRVNATPSPPGSPPLDGSSSESKEPDETKSEHSTSSMPVTT